MTNISEDSREKMHAHDKEGGRKSGEKSDKEVSREERDRREQSQREKSGNRDQEKGHKRRE